MMGVVEWWRGVEDHSHYDYDHSCPTRSLETTLGSCLFTLAVSLASWWGDPVYMQAGAARRLDLNSSLEAMAITLVCPFTPFFNSLHHVMHVLFARSIFKGRWRQDGSGSATNDTNGVENATNGVRNAAAANWNRLRTVVKEVGIMSVCPIVIPIPPRQGLDEEIDSKISSMVTSKECEILKRSQVEALRPLVMTPGAALSLRRRSDHEEEEGEEEGSRYMYFRSNHVSQSFRVALLQLRLVPLYSQLQYLRTRSRFQALITFLQTLGFTMGLVQRWGEGLGVSPLELLVSYYAITALLHVGLDLCTCVSFQTTLLLSLSPQDFERFLRHDPPLDTTRSSVHANFLAGITTAAYLLIFSTAAMSYYRILYWHSASWPTLLVFPLFISQQGSCILFMFCAISIMAARKLLLRDFQRHPIAKYVATSLAALLFSVSGLVSVALLAFAIVGTVKDWMLFNEAARNEVAWIVAKWILPHISSGN